MSDFVNSGWALFITVVTVAGLVGCLALLVFASRGKVSSSDNTTGHVWDVDIRELNNPMPRWWMWLFVGTVIFSFAYLALYPGLGSLPGALGWTSHNQLEAEQARIRASMAPVYAKFKPMAPEQLVADPEAMAIGQRLFLNICAQCHGSDARGSKGFPDLTLSAASRLATETAEQIAETIVNGRTGVMPPMGEAVGSAEDVKNVANYVLSLSGSAHNDAAAQLGKEKFAACAACHGEDGKGNKAIGAPNLTDKHWLFGGSEQAVITQIDHGRTNVMPPQGRYLTPDQVQVLAAYVWGLSQPTRVATK